MKKNSKDIYEVALWRVTKKQKAWIAKQARKFGMPEAGIVRGLITTAMDVDFKKFD